jgi:hypothetical protein
LQRIEAGQPIASRLRFAPVSAPRNAAVDIRGESRRREICGESYREVGPWQINLCSNIENVIFTESTGKFMCDQNPAFFTPTGFSRQFPISSVQHIKK